jgi:hypothetical protein
MQGEAHVPISALARMRVDWSGASEPAPGFRIGKARLGLHTYWALARAGKAAYALFWDYDAAADAARRQYEEDAWEESTHARNI